MKISNECMSCGLCSEVCPSEAIVVKDKKGTSGYSQYTIDQDLCCQCGTCLSEVDCPAGALKQD